MAGKGDDFDSLFVAWPQIVDLTGIKEWKDKGVGGGSRGG